MTDKFTDQGLGEPPLPAVLSGSKFPLGRLLATPGALAAINKAGQTVSEFLSRHEIGDWGDVCETDCDANNQSVADGSRILSAYHLNDGEKIWIITEAEYEHGRREATTVLLPSEY